MDLSFLLNTAIGAFAGAGVGSHFKNVGLWKGAFLGGVAAASLDIATPDTNRDKGIVWNSLASGLSMASLAAFGSLASAGFFPGGKFSNLSSKFAAKKMMKALNLEGEVSFGQKKELLKAYLGLRSQHGFPHGHLGKGGLGFYPVSENYAKPIQYILGLPNVADLIVSKETRFRELKGKEFTNALLKDIGMSSLYSGAIGLGLGAVYGMMASPTVNRKAQPVHENDMYKYGSIYSPATNRAYNPIY